MFIDEIPMAELCIRGFGKQVMHAMVLHTSEFNEQIKIAVDRALSKENMQHVINKYAMDLMDSVVKEVFQDRQLKHKIKDEVLKSIMGGDDIHQEATK